MRRLQVMAGIASAGLVAASLVMGAPASARDVINGTGGNDDLRGTPFSDTIRGFGGRDNVHALAGADRIGGGSGIDLLYAERGDDTSHGGLRFDYLNGGQGADTLYGGAGNDGLNGGAGSDLLFGGAGEDEIFYSPGTDTTYSGLGNDTVFLQKDGTPDTVTCGPGHDVVWGATSDNTIAADCEVLHVGQPPGCRGLPQRVLPLLREAARCE
jgi:Ca2+-binding RTX toxin-like protein